MLNKESKKSILICIMTMSDFEDKGQWRVIADKDKHTQVDAADMCNYGDFLRSNCFFLDAHLTNLF